MHFFCFDTTCLLPAVLDPSPFTLATPRNTEPQLPLSPTILSGPPGLIATPTILSRFEDPADAASQDQTSAPTTTSQSGAGAAGTAASEAGTGMTGGAGGAAAYSHSHVSHHPLLQEMALHHLLSQKACPQCGNLCGVKGGKSWQLLAVASTHTRGREGRGHAKYDHMAV